MSLARSAARSASRLSASRPALARRCFATAPSLDETYGATATVVPPAEEVAELWDEHKDAKKFTRFNKDDPLNLESLLTEEEVMVKDSVHDFCQDNLLPRVQDGFRNEEFDRSMVRHQRDRTLTAARRARCRCATFAC